MAKLITIPTNKDARGTLSVIDGLLDFDIKRIFYIYDVSSIRGGHRHKKTINALVSIAGSCEVFVDNGTFKETFLLDSPDKCLVLMPEDWHTMDKFTKNGILLVLASEKYSRDDYIDEKYEY